MLLRVKDVAKELNISPALVYQLVGKGELGSVQIAKGKAIRFKPEDVKIYIERNYTSARELENA